MLESFAELKTALDRTKALHFDALCSSGTKQKEALFVLANSLNALFWAFSVYEGARREQGGAEFLEKALQSVTQTFGIKIDETAPAWLEHDQEVGSLMIDFSPGLFPYLEWLKGATPDLKEGETHGN